MMLQSNRLRAAAVEYEKGAKVSGVAVGGPTTAVSARAAARRGSGGALDLPGEAGADLPRARRAGPRDQGAARRGDALPGSPVAAPDQRPGDAGQGRCAGRAGRAEDVAGDQPLRPARCTARWPRPTASCRRRRCRRRRPRRRQRRACASASSGSVESWRSRRRARAAPKACPLPSPPPRRRGRGPEFSDFQSLFLSSPGRGPHLFRSPLPRSAAGEGEGGEQTLRAVAFGTPITRACATRP